MDGQAILQAISSVGFPIVMCLIMVYVVYKQGEDHKEEMNSMKDALNSNTNALTELKALINSMMDKIGDK